MEKGGGNKGEYIQGRRLDLVENGEEFFHGEGGVLLRKRIVFLWRKMNLVNKGKGEGGIWMKRFFKNMLGCLEDYFLENQQ